MTPPTNETTTFVLIYFYFENEPYFGNFTRIGKSLTTREIKPLCKFQQRLTQKQCFY